MTCAQINPSQDVPIKNPYKLTSQNPEEDFHIVIYYVHANSCRVVIRRLDRNIGWPNPLNLLIGHDGRTNPTKVGDIISIPKSDNNLLDITILTFETLEKVVFQPQNIPKVIIQTGKKWKPTFPNSLYNTALTFIELNPEYIYRFYDDIQSREFIRANFPLAVLDAYDILVPGAYKADLFRYCYLYLNGGCYFDFKMILRKPLRDIIGSQDNFLICSDYDRTNSMDKKVGDSYYNAMILTVKENPLLLETINVCVDNILNRQIQFLKDVDTRGYQGLLDLTGPKLFYKILAPKITTDMLKFKHIILNHNETEYKNFVIVDFNTKEILFTKTYTIQVNPDHYSNLWIKKEIFYTNIRSVGKEKILVYPHNFPDIFEFDISRAGTTQYLTVCRIVGGWGMNLKIKVINELTSESYDLVIGPNGTCTKKINLTRQPGNILFEDTVKESDIQVKELVIGITSVIRTSNFPIGNSIKRSVISPEERFQQTIDQIDQVRVHCPNATIILLEMSIELTEAELKELSEKCDYIIRFNSKKSYPYCHEHMNKSLGEIYVITFLGRLIENKDGFVSLMGDINF